MNNLTPLLSSPSRTAALAQATARSNDAQATLANRLAERLGMEPGALQGSRDEYTPEKVAGRILDFIGQRLEAEEAGGADPERLKALMGQAREGVEKGFAEARKILDGIGALKGQVATDVDDTYQRIQSGLASLDERFGGAAATAPSTSGVSLSAYSERFVAQAETFELNVTTRDGDRLRVSIAQASADWSQSRVDASGDENTMQAVASQSSGSIRIGAWQVEVEGELDDEERASLEKLFNQVQDLSTRFYSGDLSGAFDRALALDLDGEQLASMSLRLTQTSVRQATDAYSSVAGQGGQAADAVNRTLADYAQGLLDSLRTANSLVEEAPDSLLDLLRGGFSLDERFDAGRLDKAERLNSRLLDGLQSVVEATTPGAQPAP
ncbi:MAG: DUF5610 domain-containing protein [Gammaproteobacteria bacterium]|nr:DUF5610 domain-containing protein [Gammaproteobacteria bacterium]MBU1490146.1 DUF5610 domain-containing protein [Gammaproteobacteria bacterium]MBU2067909.1 DUF5610 domain-containing protein [Gammaproteobacteria bacterium]MBU2140623.1 DUF5610 domain-containing protein [Gammaproteobacteria bacterium]MBU2215277.1 DUF5610 domain-containing protein [Gammaproteobacteria bacterium]